MLYLLRPEIDLPRYVPPQDWPVQKTFIGTYYLLLLIREKRRDPRKDFMV